MKLDLFAPARRSRALVMLVLVVTLLVAGFLWAAFMHIELRSQALGQVVASARTQVVQASVDGVI
jgi:uncharacterized protein involved in exopolysaccharide biosynthesis